MCTEEVFNRTASIPRIPLDIGVLSDAAENWEGMARFEHFYNPGYVFFHKITHMVPPGSILDNLVNFFLDPGKFRNESWSKLEFCPCKAVAGFNRAELFPVRDRENIEVVRVYASVKHTSVSEHGTNIVEDCDFVLRNYERTVQILMESLQPYRWIGVHEET